MNIQGDLSFPFKDSNWMIKFLIGGALSLVCLTPLMIGLLFGLGIFTKILTYLLFLVLIVIFFAPMGYFLAILRDAINGQQPTLPEWKNWEVLVKDGALAFAVCLVYGLAIALVNYLVSMLITHVPVLGAIFSLLQIVIGLLILLAGPFFAIALSKLAQSGKIAASFNVLEIFHELKSKAVDYVTVSLILFGIKEIVNISFGVNLFATMIATRIFTNYSGTFPLVSLLMPFAMFWYLVVSFRMYGEIYGKK